MPGDMYGQQPLEGQYPMMKKPVPIEEQGPEEVPSTVPELEQVLVKTQELESRVGDLEVKDAQENGEYTVGEQESEEPMKPVAPMMKKYGPEVKPFRVGEQAGNGTRLPEEEKDEQDKTALNKKYEFLAKKYNRLMHRYNEQNGNGSDEEEEEEEEKKYEFLRRKYNKLAYEYNEQVNENGNGENKEENEEEEEKTTSEKYKRSYERLIRAYREARRRLKEQGKGELTGLPEIEKDKRKKTWDQAADAEVPQAQTSEIEGNGTKTGAPVAGEEIDDKFSRKAEDEAISEVPKPKSEHPHEPIIKNSLRRKEQEATVGKVTDDTIEDPTTTADAGEPAPIEPNLFEDKEGKKVSGNAYEKLYGNIVTNVRKEGKNNSLAQRMFKEKMSKLSGRRSVTGVSQEGYSSVLSTRQRASNTIREYLKISGHRI